jgi:hypothetical protein
LTGPTWRRRPAPTHFDPFLDDVELRQGYRALVDGRWADFERALGTESGGWLLRSTLTSDDAAIETIVLQRFAEARPSGLALALLGGAKVRDALVPVTGYDGRPRPRSEVEAELAEAESVLERAVELEPSLADPWIHLLWSGWGLDVGVGKLRSRFEQAQGREPFRADACRAYLTGLQAVGSPGAVLDFAHWVQSEAPPGSPARESLPRAHLELGRSLAHGASLTAYLSRPERIGDLVPALGAFLAATPEIAEPVHLPTLNAYGLAMTVVDDHSARLTRECFRRIDNRPTSYPWSLYPGETIPAVFGEAQRTQLRSADHHAPVR